MSELIFVGDLLPIIIRSIGHHQRVVGQIMATAWPPVVQPVADKNSKQKFGLEFDGGCFLRMSQVVVKGRSHRPCDRVSTYVRPVELPNRKGSQIYHATSRSGH